jgi:hypothetical protein
MKIVRFLPITFLTIHYSKKFEWEKPTGGQRFNPAFVSDIEKKVLSRTVEMETDQTFQ